MRYPKDMDVWEHAPGRRLPRWSQAQERERCAGRVRRHSKRVWGGHTDRVLHRPEQLRCGTIAFAEVGDAPEGLQGLRDRLKSLGVVESVGTMAAEDGSMVDKQHFPVRWAGRRAVVMGADALNEMLNRLWDVDGSGAATIID